MRESRVGDRVEAGLARLSELGRSQQLITTVCVALPVLALAFGRGLTHTPDDLVPAVVASAPLLAVRRHPAVALTLVLAANAVFVFTARLQWPIADILAWLIALTLCPILLGRRAAVLALLATESVVLATAVVEHPGSSTPWDATVAQFLAVLLAWTLGSMLNGRRATTSARADAARREQELRQRDALSRERVGIARELHDVVAHHISLVAVRAATARYAVPDLSPAAERAFDEIADQARTALVELRTVLGVLRTEASAPEHAPQPTLDDIPALVDRARTAGARIALELSGDGAAPESVQLCAYRIVQEALTNAGRHAPGSDVLVVLDRRADELLVRVEDDGAPAVAGGEPGSGLGLVGMRERVAAVGGSLQLGATARGFTVEARLPLPASLAPDASTVVG